MQLPGINPAHRNIMIAASMVSLAFVWFVNLPINVFDLVIYYKAIINVLHGMWPWANGVEFYYPPLAFAPMLVAYVFSLIVGSSGFVLGMWLLMISFDIVTTFCIYYIGLKLYSEQKAFVAAMLNATAVSVAYYVFTRFDAFPAALALIAVLATVYRDQTKGYLWAVVGLFTKLWPMLLFPFLWPYNARESSVLGEGKKRAIWFLLGSGLVFGLMLWAGYNKFLGYAERVYVNTIPYIIHHTCRWQVLWFHSPLLPIYSGS